jgi:hypothetical protein
LVMNLKGTKARNDCTGEYEHDLTDWPTKVATQ